MSFLDGAVVVSALLAAAWWGLARRHGSVVLTGLSLGTLGLAAIALLAEGWRWQLVPWQLLGLIVALAAGLRWWRPGRSRRWSRVLGRLGLSAVAIAGGLALLLTVRVPTLPQPAGPYPVGSQVFRWTDEQRPEPFTADPLDRRQVVAQAWYPTEAVQGRPVPYFEAQDQLPPFIDPFPAWFYGAFGEVDTHAADRAPVSAERPTWPVLLFLPGWGSPRESYTALCTDLASRGYVVVALSHPYESAVSLLADGRAVGPVAEATILGGDMAHMSAIRVDDSRFVLDQFSQLAHIEPLSPLTGHLDVQHVGIVGHSLGGATAIQVLANDSRFLVGVNIDGILFDAMATTRLNRPLLWLQSDGTQQAHYLQVRDQLLGELRGGGELLIVGGSSHGSFTDSSTYLSPTGNKVFAGEAGSLEVGPITSMTGDVIAGFVGPRLGGPNDPNLELALARHPSIKQERRIASTTPS